MRSGAPAAHPQRSRTLPGFVFPLQRASEAMRSGALAGAMHAERAVAVARELAADFRRDAAQRDLAAGTPKPQRDAIRASGLLGLRIPVEFGGADASLAHLYAYHHLDLITPHLIGTPAQRQRWYTATARDNLFWGNCLNPLDPRTTLTRVDATTFRLHGT